MLPLFCIIIISKIIIIIISKIIIIIIHYFSNHEF